MTIRKNGANGTSNTQAYLIGESIELTAPEYNDVNFLYWAQLIGDRVVVLSSKQTCYVHVTKDITIYAIYSSNHTNQKYASNSVTGIGAETVEGKDKVWFQVSRTVPSDYTLLNHGILYSSANWSSLSDESIENALKFTALDSTGSSGVICSPKEGVKYKTASLGTNDGIVDWHMGIGSNPNTTIYMRGYLVILSNGYPVVKYTDVYVVSFNGLKNGSPDKIIKSSTSIEDVSSEDIDDDFEF